MSTCKDDNNLSISFFLPTMVPKNFNNEIGSWTKCKVTFIEEAIYFKRSVVDKSSPSETKKIFPAASGCSRQQTKKSIRLSIPIRERLLFKLSKGSGMPNFISLIKLILEDVSTNK